MEEDGDIGIYCADLFLRAESRASREDGSSLTPRGRGPLPGHAELAISKRRLVF
jgi:hypothetical protein